jgi:antitoxin component HigA of HigAB toxin-antitoxin module|tara:strand:+ start:130 stop:552 length:423 start_codon:yes stop_codon:yes gene_type:complete
MQSSIGAVEVRRDNQTDHISIREVDENTYSTREYDHYMNTVIARMQEDMENYLLIERSLIDDITAAIVISQEMHERAKPKITIENFEKLEKCNEITNCSICFENMKDNIKLKCDHIYCSECIKKWLTERSNTCPTCRAEI